MKTIQIDDDIYQHLKTAGELGENASSILRRLLNLPHQRGVVRASEGPRNGQSQRQNAIDECLNDHRFRVERDAVGKFLYLLGWLRQRHPAEFSRVLEIRGRSRKYFGRSENELVESGESVNPQKIPNSDFWVVTNNDTPKKGRILSDVMRLFGYGAGEINLARGALN